VIAGATSKAQVEANVEAALWHPTLEDLAELDELTA
jgi:aryl-alcohol dehydrogenase-like predicted oxidoreductase